MQYVPPGKFLRLPFLYRREKPIIIAPIDDYLIFGPRGGLEDPKEKITKIVQAKPDAILTFCGTLQNNAHLFQDTPIIVNLSASTTQVKHTRKRPVHKIEYALKLNAAAVAFHINIMSQWADEMIAYAGELVAEAAKFDLPTICIAYPRGESSSGDDNQIELKESSPGQYADLIAHCVSVAVDLGFDLIKTYYTDNPETFKRVVKAAGGVPIVIAGGELVSEEKAYSRAIEAIRAGAAGISYGRNVFGRADPQSLMEMVKNCKD